MFASWSSRETTTSSPGRQVLASVREKSNVSCVMLRPKTMPAGVGAQQVGHRLPGRQHDLRRRTARPRSTRPRLAIAAVRVSRDRVGHHVGHLRATRPVEVRRALLQRREVRADRCDVELISASKGT